MKKLSMVFAGIVIMTILLFVLSLIVMTVIEREVPASTQGVLLIKSTTVPTIDENVDMQTRIGDTFWDASATVYRINEIRRTTTNTVYVLVSTKSLTNFKTYIDYLSKPYRGNMTFDVKYFIQGKMKVEDYDIEQFYMDNKIQLDTLIPVDEIDATKYRQGQDTSSADIDYRY